jgi:hypothetical protein
MFSKTKIALAAALIFGSASAALAADSGENHQGNDRSVSGIVARVNPGWLGTSANAGSAYGYAAPIQMNRPGREHDYSDRTDDNR